MSSRGRAFFDVAWAKLSFDCTAFLSVAGPLLVGVAAVAALPFPGVGPTSGDPSPASTASRSTNSKPANSAAPSEAFRLRRAVLSAPCADQQTLFLPS